MLTDIELGLRARARAGHKMVEALCECVAAHDFTLRQAARQRYEIYRDDYRSIQQWLEVKMLCALLQSYGVRHLALGYDEVAHTWRVIEG